MKTHLILDVATSLRGRTGPIVCFALAFELLRFLVLAPLGAGALRVFLERWGRCSVGNFEIVAFLLSPPGLAALLAAGTIALATFHVEIGGLVLLVADRQSNLRSILPALGKRLFRLLVLGLRQFAVLLALAVPFLGTIAGALAALWAGADLNGLIVLKPPVFWMGVAIGVCLGAGYAVAGGHLLLRWLLALPAVLFEPDAGAGRAMRLSAERTRGRLARTLGLVLVWLAAVLLLSGVLMGGLRFGAAWLLDRVGLSLSVLLPVTAVVLIVHALAAALLAVVASASFASLVLALYRDAVGGPSPDSGSVPETPDAAARLPAGWLIAGVAAALLGAVGLACYGLLAGVRGMEVHAWTVNDLDALVPLVDRGVANIITDDPAAMRRRLEEVQSLGPAERILLRARNLLAD